MIDYDPEEFEDIEGGGGASVRRLYWRAIKTLLIALGIQTIAGLSPTAIDSYYSRKLYLFIPWLLAKLNRMAGFSFSEIFFLLLVGVFLLWGLWSALKAFRGQTPILDSLKVIVLYAIWTASVLFVIFKLMWGLNYQRLPLAEGAGFEDRYAKTEELNQIGLAIVNGIRNNFTPLPGSGSNAGGGAAATGTAEVALSAENERLRILEFSKVIDHSFLTLDLFNELDGWDFGPPKLLWSSPMIRLLGVRSFYLPFTGEVSVQGGLATIDLPFAIARAKAYQRGFAREDEANFVAYLVCINAVDQVVRYSGYLHGAKVLEVLERSGIGSYLDSLGEGPRRHISQRQAGADWMLGSLTRSIVDGIFNLHLRVNRVVQGTKSADGDAGLIVSYYLTYKNRTVSQFPGGSVVD
ncbi:MAG: DUF3810 family protein [Blastocatellia bacterium]